MIPPQVLLRYIPLGIIHQAFQDREDAPRQTRLSDAGHTPEIKPEFFLGLQDVEYPPHNKRNYPQKPQVIHFNCLSL